VRQAVPLGRALERHVHDVVRVAEAARVVADERADRGHEVLRVEAADHRAGLRPLGAEREAEAEDAPVLHGRGGAPDGGGVDQVERAALVVGAPASPVGDALRDGADPLHPVSP
jgi:hypothetical protein